MERLLKHHTSFKNAISGIVWIVKTQHNFQVHLLLAILAFLLGILLSVSRFEMLLILTTIFFGIVAEMINTALEAITDLVTIEWRKEAKIAKDVSAGMMLVVALGALIIGLYIFIPKILSFIV